MQINKITILLFIVARSLHITQWKTITLVHCTGLRKTIHCHFFPPHPKVVFAFQGGTKSTRYKVALKHWCQKSCKICNENMVLLKCSKPNQMRIVNYYFYGDNSIACTCVQFGICLSSVSWFYISVFLHGTSFRYAMWF